MRQQQFCRLRVCEDSGERLVQLVRHRRGKLPHPGHAVEVSNLAEMALRRRLSLAAASALNEQRDDERRLHPDESDCAYDMPAVLLPERPLGKDDLAALR